MLTVLLAALAGSAAGQEETATGSTLSFAISGGGYGALFGAGNALYFGSSASAAVRYRLGFLPLYAELEAYATRNGTQPVSGAISTAGAGAGAGVAFDLSPRLLLTAGGRAGYGYSVVKLDNDRVAQGAFGWGAGLGAYFRILPAWSVGLETALTSHVNTFFGVDVGIAAVFSPAGLSAREPREPRVRPEQIRPQPLVQVAETPADDDFEGTVAEYTRGDLHILDMRLERIFPVLYRKYNSQSLGTYTLRNTSDREISNIQIMVNIPRFMDIPQRQTVAAALAPGEEVRADIMVLFSDNILDIYEPTTVAVQLQTEYTSSDRERSFTLNTILDVVDRNAVTWDDDRKVAAFVTARDPGLVLFARNVASVVRASGFDTLNLQLRTAMAMLSALNIHGMNYVVDPTTPYEQYSGLTHAIDYVQFPRQTLEYRAGDCDDLSVCYVSALQAVGVDAAFITVPGHIYTAINTGLSESDARAFFGRPDELIFADGHAWIPVETTLLNDGFMRAWEVGAKQWLENSQRGQAVLIPVADAWKVYEPAGPSFEGQAAAVAAPDATQLRVAYTSELGRFVDREIMPQVLELQRRISETSEDPRYVNRLGVLYAKYGKLDDAKAQFQKIIRARPTANAYVNLGNLLYLSGDVNGALDQYERAAALAPNNPTVVLSLAKAHHDLQNYGFAERSYRQLAQLDPQLAGQFRYLEFRGEEAARAAEAANVAGVMIWAEEEE